jgi:hypothetical protein
MCETFEIAAALRIADTSNLAHLAGFDAFALHIIRHSPSR